MHVPPAPLCPLNQRYEHFLKKQPGTVKYISPLPTEWERQIVRWAVCRMNPSVSIQDVLGKRQCHSNNVWTHARTHTQTRSQRLMRIYHAGHSHTR